MSRVEASIYAFLILFVIIFLVYYFIVNRRYLNNLSKRKSKKIELIEITYLTKKFNLDLEKINLNRLLIVTALFNSLIISTSSLIIILIDIHIFFKLGIGLVLVFSLIYSLYEILGRILVKKGFDKNER